MARIAAEMGLIPHGAAVDKRSLRDTVRNLENGERLWMEIQAEAYGPRMGEAEVIEGAREFFLRARESGAKLYIISHKTEYAATDTQNKTSLRRAAMEWLERAGFFSGQMGIEVEDVFFEPTRAEKIARISKMRCEIFIDDLEEVFLDSSFPPGVSKILFSPSPQSALQVGVTALGLWSEVADNIFGSGQVAADDEAFALAPLLEGIPFPGGARAVSAERIGRGGNSSVCLVTCDDSSRYALKAYAGPTMDGRERLRVEFGALEFLKKNGVKYVPAPVHADFGKRLGLYEYIEGEPSLDNFKKFDGLGQALNFVTALKGMRGACGASNLPTAAEACFSVAGLVANVSARFQRLGAAMNGKHDMLAKFLSGKAIPSVAELAKRAEEIMARGGLPANGELPSKLRTLSPSDFGFHNAITRPGGEIVFLDFEYFGWDDPAKMISDFILHPAMSLDKETKLRFVTETCRIFGDDDGLATRLSATLPLFGMKWAAIMLNEFLPGHPRNIEGEVGGATRATQLARAQALVDDIVEDGYLSDIMERL
jgi:hypothetical protein